jgi:hypothetical protein
MDLISIDEVLTYIGAFSLILGFFWSLHKVYIHFIKPKRKLSKYHKLYELIEDWFDEIDKNLEMGLNYPLLNNKENKIRQYITDNSIKDDKIKFHKRFKKKFLKLCGIKKTLRNNNELFIKYSRQPIDWTYLENYINTLLGAFYTFSSNYNAKNENANFAEVEMRVKLLKLYWGYKRK